MQNHLAFSLKLSFGPELCEIEPNVGTWRETLRENIVLLYFYATLRFWPPDSVFYGFNVLLNFLAEKRYRTNMKSPQKASSGPEP